MSAENNNGSQEPETRKDSIDTKVGSTVTVSKPTITVTSKSDISWIGKLILAIWRIIK